VQAIWVERREEDFINTNSECELRNAE
jgi:hypothetical protein